MFEKPRICKCGYEWFSLNAYFGINKKLKGHPFLGWLFVLN
jgi:hypothetical protein